MEAVLAQAGISMAVQEQKAQEKLDGAHDAAEHVRDRRAEQGQNHDHDHGNQHQDQSVFDEALALVIFEGKHGRCPFMNKLKKDLRI